MLNLPENPSLSNKKEKLLKEQIAEAEEYLRRILERRRKIRKMTPKITADNFPYKSQYPKHPFERRTEKPNPKWEESQCLREYARKVGKMAAFLPLNEVLNSLDSYQNDGVGPDFLKAFHPLNALLCLDFPLKPLDDFPKNIRDLINQQSAATESYLLHAQKRKREIHSGK